MRKSIQYGCLFQTVAAVLMSGAFGCTTLRVVAQEDVTKRSQASITEADLEAESPSAPVEVDGNVLFSVRGVSAFPAQERAAGIAGRIKAFADTAVPVADVRLVEDEVGLAIFADNQRLMVVTDADAKLASLPRKTLADLIVFKIQNAVTEYRQARSRAALIKSVVRTGVASAIVAALIALVVWLSRRLHEMLERRYRRRIQAVGIQSFQVVRAEQIWIALQRLIYGGRAILILAIGFIYLQYVLAFFPWTRGTSYRIRGYILGPLKTIANGFVNAIPALIFLVILYFVTRWALKLIHRFFDALRRGEVKLSGFDADWAESTYKLVRLGSCWPL